MKNLLVLFLLSLTLIFSNQSFGLNDDLKLDELTINADRGYADAQALLGMMYYEVRA